jgi:type VI protein secretion system component Hcp
LKNCQISSIKTCLPNIKEPGSEGKVHQEEVSIRYEEITWLAKDGNQSYTDSWTDR